MLRISFLLFITLICSPIHNIFSSSIKLSVDSVFVRWNKATLGSLERQKNSTDHAQRKKSYVNRIWGFPMYLDIKNSDTVNRMSLRYLFLKELLSNKTDKPFYVIEANNMGAHLTIRNFVIHKNNLGNIEVQLYTYFNQTWHKEGKTQLKSFKLDQDLTKYTLKGDGFNYEDIIVTRFEGKEYTSVTSEYYLDGTLSIDSGIKKILDDYDEDKFKP